MVERPQLQGVKDRPKDPRAAVPRSCFPALCGLLEFKSCGASQSPELPSACSPSPPSPPSGFLTRLPLCREPGRGFTRLSEVLLDAEMVKEHCFSGSEVMKGKEQNRHALNEDWKLQMKHDQHQYFLFCYTTLPICKFKYWWTWNHLSHWLGNDLRSCWVNVLSLHFCHFLKNQLMWP